MAGLTIGLIFLLAAASHAVDPETILKGCSMAGKATGTGAVVQGCAAVSARCRMRPSVKTVPFSSISTTESEQVDEVLKRTCDILFESECEQAALDGIEENGDRRCAVILKNGPLPQAGCETIEEAKDIFISSLPECRNPCACSVDGIANGIATNRGQCKQHRLEVGDEDYFCYVVSSEFCSKDVITASEGYPGTYWKLCKPSL